MSGIQVNRRTFVAAAAVLASGIATRPALAAPPPARLLDIAAAGLRRHSGNVAVTDMVAIADFAAPSAAPRFHLVDMATGSAESFLVAHGRGSDPDHSGWLRRFSNDPGSYCTSEGAYRTLGYYQGAHGRSMRLAGLDPTNNQAEARAIVVHSAKYVSAAIARDTGVLGRSEGCFAVAEGDLPRVLQRMGPGRLLLAGRFGA